MMDTTDIFLEWFSKLYRFVDKSVFMILDFLKKQIDGVEEMFRIMMELMIYIIEVMTKKVYHSNQDNFKKV